MSDHDTQTRSADMTIGGPDQQKWQQAVEAARTILSSDCGWLEMITRAILEERGVPYGIGDPHDVPAPRIPTNHEIKTMNAHSTDMRGDETKPGYELPPASQDDEPDDTTPMQESLVDMRNTTGTTSLETSEERELSADESRALTNQYGTRIGENATYYPNLAAFVELWLANVFPYQQGPSVNMQWVEDWWRYPSLVFPLDALWRAYENARKQPGQMMIFYIQCSSVIDRLFNKDSGIVKSLETKQLTTLEPGDPLPCKRPPRAWRKPILERMDPPGAANRAVTQDNRASRQSPGEPRRTVRTGMSGRK